MSVDRVATNSQAQFMLDRINRANVQLTQAQNQVSSGNVSNSYEGYGGKVAVLEAARSAGARVDAYQTATQQAITQVDLQDTQISSLADLAAQLRQALTDAVGQGNGASLMTEADSIFQSAAQILNAKDANGNYIYGGEKSDTPPFTVNSLSDLSSLSQISDAFANGTLKSSVRIGDGETVQMGQLASDMGSDLMSTLKTIQDYVNSNGAFTDSINTTQSDFLASQITVAKTASENLNNVAAANGFVYNRLKDATEDQDAMTTLYKGFVSNIQEVDMPTAVTKLNQSQVALQAALQVTAQLQQISLLNYMGS
jgi:flagellar hook-associated protein 3 FlgL